MCSSLQPLPAPSTTTATAVAAAAGGPRKPRKRTGNLEELHHPLLGDEPTLQLLPDRSEVAGVQLMNSMTLRYYWPTDWKRRSRRTSHQGAVIECALPPMSVPLAAWRA